MKTKKFEKNLMLNKVTIAHLNREEMDVLHGGNGDPQLSCPCLQTEVECDQRSAPTSCRI